MHLECVFQTAILHEHYRDADASGALQRMCDDVPAFTDASVTLVIGIVKKFFMMIGFSGGPPHLLNNQAWKFPIRQLRPYANSWLPQISCWPPQHPVTASIG